MMELAKNVLALERVEQALHSAIARLKGRFTAEDVSYYENAWNENARNEWRKWRKRRER